MEEIKNQKNVTEYLIPSFIVICALALAIIAKAAVFPIILSAALAYILYPLVKYFEVRGIKRIYVVAGFYIMAGIAISSLIYSMFYFISFEIETFQKDWPIYVQKINIYLTGVNEKLLKNYPLVANFNLNDKLSVIIQEIPQIILGFVPALTLLFVVPFVTFFMLLGGPEVMDYILDHIPSKYVELALHITSRIDASLGNYMRGILTEAFIIFSIAFVGLMVMNLDYAAVIAIIIGISSLVPYLGAIVGALISSVVAYFQFGGFMVINVLIFFACIRFVDDWFLQPYIMKRAVKLNPVIVIFSLMAGWELGGIWGVIFSIPVTCILKETLKLAVELQETEFMWKPKPNPTRISIPYT
ncbi:MAG: AI-2E family transporter [Elusimicrobia bacterium]|nr:AI-2E family transporter [Elusimicrobiota bacterium]